MKKLEYKHCKICNIEVFGTKRNNRKSYSYPSRCDSCKNKQIKESFTINCLSCGHQKIIKGTIKKITLLKSQDFSKYQCRLCALREAIKNKNKVSIEHKKKIKSEHYQKTREIRDKYCNDWRRAKRLEIICQYGGHCVHCGEDDPVVLDFDHINDDGALDKKIYGKQNIVNILIKVGYVPHKIQLLCKNCNWRKEFIRRQKKCQP